MPRRQEQGQPLHESMPVAENLVDGLMNIGASRRFVYPVIRYLFMKIEKRFCLSMQNFIIQGHMFGEGLPDKTLMICAHRNHEIGIIEKGLRQGPRHMVAVINLPVVKTVFHIGQQRFGIAYRPG